MEDAQSISDQCGVSSCDFNQAPSFESQSFRVRGSLARALYRKQQHDDFLSNFDKRKWYQCDLSEVPSSLASKFVQLDPDQDTLDFLEESEKKSDWILTQMWHSLAKLFLGWFMTQTSINGWLQRGSMFVLSQSHFRKILRVEETWSSGSLLDLGAGDGGVTAHMAPLFKKTYATDVSPTMKSLLQKQGYEVLDVDNWYIDKKFDVISCLNLLDRCDEPLKMLDQIGGSLATDGRVLMAIVLPFSVYVESSPDHKPKESLQIKGSSFEKQVESIVKNVLEPANFEIVSWSRVPYLCEGDLQQSYYWLDDSIFVLKKRHTD
ncbi:protein-L-histidine N-pros-methyltransferase [Leptinotarsa decemlineata]|uniref:protein-L-histidine N-pros-methyltransferase n=1 Tax=Leptinotarsa decemlineata TaxID=7539 RepID=UPI000C2539E0|nr:methyltransferase-like protein 9 [Leptinotarsa decemlineata]